MLIAQSMEELARKLGRTQFKAIINESPNCTIARPIGSLRMFFNVFTRSPELSNKCPDSTRLQPIETTEFPSFDNLNQVLHYCDQNIATLQPSTVSLLLNELSNAMQAPDELPGKKQLSEDLRLQRLLKCVSESSTLMNAQDCIHLLQALVKISRKLPAGSSLIHDAGSPILKRLIRDDFTDVEQIAWLTYLLIQLGITDLSLKHYLRNIIPKIIKKEKISFLAVRTMLRALREFKVRSTEFFSPLADALTNGIDYFSNEDVVDTFRLDYETNAVNRPCGVKLTEIVSKNPELFSTSELVELYSLCCTLQYITPNSASNIVNQLEARIDMLSAQQLIQILVGSIQIGERYVDKVLPFLSSALSLLGDVNNVGLDEAVKLSYAICFYDLQDYKSALETLLQHYMRTTTKCIPTDHLAMLSEILVSIENEFELRLEVPEHLTKSLDRYALSVSVDWRVRKHVLNLQDKLPNPVSFKPNVVVGPYVAPFLDENEKLILEVAMPKSPVGTAMRQRHFKRLGYTALKLCGKSMITTRIPDILLENLRRALNCRTRSTAIETNEVDLTAAEVKEEHQSGASVA